MSYLYNQYQDPDTSYPGSDTPPSQFSNGEDNYSYTYAYSQKEDNHEISELSSDTLSNV